MPLPFSRTGELPMCTWLRLVPTTRLSTPGRFWSAAVIKRVTEDHCVYVSFPSYASLSIQRNSTSGIGGLKGTCIHGKQTFEEESPAS